MNNDPRMNKSKPGVSDAAGQCAILTAKTLNTTSPPICLPHAPPATIPPSAIGYRNALWVFAYGGARCAFGAGEIGRLRMFCRRRKRSDARDEMFS